MVKSKIMGMLNGETEETKRLIYGMLLVRVNSSSLRRQFAGEAFGFLIRTLAELIDSNRCVGLLRLIC